MRSKLSTQEVSYRGRLAVADHQTIPLMIGRTAVRTRSGIAGPPPLACMQHGLHALRQSMAGPLMPCLRALVRTGASDP